MKILSLTLFPLSFFLSMKLLKGFFRLYDSVCLSINVLYNTIWLFSPPINAL